MDQKLLINILVNDKSKQALSRLQGNLEKVKKSIFNLKNAFLGFGAGVVIKGFVDAGIQIENLEVQLKALFGSAQAGRKALQAVTEYAVKTPFELKNIQQGITSLAVVRDKAEEAGISFEELLKITGNTATLLGNDFALASLQVQRSLSAGIASAELFRERGVTAMAGFTAGVRTTALESAKALKKTFGTGGEFGRLTEDLSQTVGGTISNLKDAFFTFQVAVAEGFFGTMKKQLGDLQTFVENNNAEIKKFGAEVGAGLSKAINGLSRAVLFARDNFESLKNIFIIIVGIKIIGFFITLGKVIRDLTVIVQGLTVAMLANPAIATAALVASGIGLIASAILSAKDNTEAWAQSLEEIDLSDFTGQKVDKTLKDLGGFNVLKNPELRQYRKGKSRMFGFEGSPEIMGVGRKEPIVSMFEKVRDSVKQLNEKELLDFENKFKNIHEIVGKGINSGITSLSQGIAESLVLGKNLSDTFKNLAQTLTIKILSALIEIVARKGIELAIEKLITKEKEKQRNLSAASGNPLAILSFFGGFAKGGAVRKGQPTIVGEQGPELFIPNQTGQITQNARGTGGSPVNVNFSITTLDARGFEEMLVQNRGTISNIINQAVNERGGRNLI